MSQEITDPPSGVAGFPTNHLLKRLIDNSPLKKERKAFSEAVEKRREEMTEINRDFEKLKEVHSNVVEESKKKMKDQVKSEAKRLAKKIEAEERNSLSQVDASFKEMATKDPFELKYTEVKQLCSKVSTSWRMQTRLRTKVIGRNSRG